MSSAYRFVVVAFAAALVLAQLHGCGGEDSESLGVSNVSPGGSIGGLVVDAATQKAMVGVKVAVIAGGKIYPDAAKPAVTDATGYFAVGALPSGNLLIQVTPTDISKYEAITISAVLPNAAGEFPLANATLSLGPIGLVPLATATKAFKVQLITPQGAAPTTGLKAYLQAPVAYVDFNGNTIKPRGTIIVDAATTATGALTFAGMPDYALLAGLVGSGGISDLVRVRIPPTDIDKDGSIDFLGKEVSFNVNKLKGTIPTIVLSSSAKPSKLIIEAASVAALMGKSGNRMITGNHVAGTIFLSFNLPVLADMTQVQFYNEYGAALQVAPTSPAISVLGNTMQIKFASLKAGAEYNMNLRTFSKVEGTYYEGNFGAPFFTPAAAQGTLTATLGRDAVDTTKVLVTFSEPIGAGIANKHLASVVFFDYDINGSGVKGDAPAEFDATNSSFATSSNITLFIDESEPPGPAGKSGLSSKWYFTLPLDSSSNPIPSNTKMAIIFSRSGQPVQHANAKLVTDLKNLSVPF
jgi:hypothetical protein